MYNIYARVDVRTPGTTLLKKKKCVSYLTKIYMRVCGGLLSLTNKKCEGSTFKKKKDEGSS